MNERKNALLMTAFALCLLGLLMAGPVGRTWAQDPGPGVQAGTQGTVPPLIQYQGRITNSAGEPISGTYTIYFRIYNVDTGGIALWEEGMDLYVDGGLLNHVLGDGGGTPLNATMFNGQQLWLGVKVGADLEATPRQELLAVPYALSLAPGAIISGTAAPATLVIRNLGGTALQVDGNLNVSGSLIGGSHNHDSLYYNKTTSNNIFVNAGSPDTIDLKESVPALTVIQAGSGIGISSTAGSNIGLRGATGNMASEMAGVLGVAGWTNTMIDGYAGVYGKSASGAGLAGVTESGKGVLAKSGSGYGVYATTAGSLPALYAENTDGGVSIKGYKANGTDGAAVQGYTYGNGRGIEAYSAGGWSAYVWGGGSGALYAGGNSEINGTLKTQKLTYSTARTHYLSVAAESFRAMNSANSFISGWNGACYTAAPAGVLVGAVALPDNAVIQYLTGYFYDTHETYDVNLALERHVLATNSYGGILSISSDYTAGYRTVTSAYSGQVVDNTSGGYYVYAWFDGNTADCSKLKLVGARIQYSVSEAE